MASQIIQVETIEELKEIFVKILLSRTNKITKVSDGSVVNAVAYGSAKLAQKALKDIALAQSHFYPDTAYGQYLDNIATMYGIAARYGALGSSSYLRVVGAPGTIYTAGTQVFSGSNGINFDLLANKTIGAEGFAYVQVSSQTIGANTNVEPLAINKVTPIPLGHTYVINEYTAVGGRDIEDDDTFRNRIKNDLNQFARGTLAMLTQVFMKFNPNVLRVLNYGSDGLGKILLGVAAQNGSFFTTPDFDTLLSKASQYLSLSELNPDGLGNVGVVLQNITYEPIDISFRVELLTGFLPDELRKDIQLRMNKEIDYRFWLAGDKIDFANLLSIVRQTEGVKYAPDNFFYINALNQDFTTNMSMLPRIRSFLMLDLLGNIISTGGSSLNPTFFPSSPDSDFQRSVLQGIV